MTSHAVEQDAGDGTAVVAHGLLTSMAVVSAGVATVWEHWEDLSPEKRDRLFQRILAHADIVNEGLRIFTQGLPEAAIAEIEAQRRHQQQQ